MTPLEIVALIGLSFLVLLMGMITIEQFVLILRRIKANKEINKMIDEAVKNIDKTIKDFEHDKFFADLERIKEENKEKE